ncbi:MAG TPA: acetylxylan esterase [Candidatus Lokiarchaeia archaeon]|nr:acetylxylan esterase [Candidatus Lokiarchaeia archaeon]
MRIPDKWYIFGIELPYRRTGEQNLKKINNTYRNLVEWQARRQTIREGILKHAGLFPLPKRTPLNVVTHGLRELNGYAVENVIFESVPGFFVSGNLYRPLHPPENELIPVISRPHGHKKNARFQPEYQTMNATLARMGAMNFIYDMVGFGENQQVPHNYPRVLMFQIWNSMRVLDFLVGLDGVDATRVGMTGESGGGTQTFLCSALDNRVTAPAPLIQVSSGFFGGCTCESGMPIYKGQGYKTNFAEIAALAAPRPQLIVSDGNDWTRMVPKREFPFIKSVYRLHGAENKVENVHLQNDVHDLKENKRQAVYKFYAKTFGLDVSAMTLSDGSIDESATVIEPEEVLHVYTEEYPRPQSALKDGDAVLDRFRELGAGKRSEGI